MTITYERLAGIAGLTAIATFVANLSFTAEGPSPVADPVVESARIAADSDAIRLSAVLGAVGGIGLAAFVLLLALAASERSLAQTVAILSAGVFCALDLTSEAALAASAQSADTGLGPDAVMSFGHLHSTTLLIAFAPLAISFAAVAHTRTSARATRWSAVLLAIAGSLTLLTLLSAKLDEGPFGVAVVIVFLGMPIWIVALSIGLLRADRIAAPAAEAR
jgi:hypothetical protein